MNSFFTLAASMLLAGSALVVAAEIKDPRVYEMRIYYAAPEKVHTGGMLREGKEHGGLFVANGTGQLRYTDSGADMLVQIDLNGDGAADMQIVLAGRAGQGMTSTDFLF